MNQKKEMSGYYMSHATLKIIDDDLLQRGVELFAEIKDIAATHEDENVELLKRITSVIDSTSNHSADQIWAAVALIEKMIDPYMQEYGCDMEQGGEITDNIREALLAEKYAYYERMISLRQRISAINTDNIEQLLYSQRDTEKVNRLAVTSQS
jgi:hypothetical protein